MKIHLIKEQTVWDYVERHASSKPAFVRWLEIIKIADWEKPEDMARTFPSADNIGKSANRVIFNFGGNNHRIICKYLFGETKVHLFIKWKGTHAEYTKLCETGDYYTIEEF